MMLRSDGAKARRINRLCVPAINGGVINNHGVYAVVSKAGSYSARHGRTVALEENHILPTEYSIRFTFSLSQSRTHKPLREGAL